MQEFQHQYTRALLLHVERGEKTVEDLSTQSERKAEFADNPSEYLASAQEAIAILQQPS